MFLLSQGYVLAETGIESSPLKFTLKADKESYSVGDEIKIFYTIENTSSEPAEFYVQGHYNLEIFVNDLSGTQYRHYFYKGIQRSDQPSYPDEYVLLDPQEKWQGSAKIKLKKGQVEDYNEEGGKSSPRQSYVVHDGLYLSCDGEDWHCLNADVVFLPDRAEEGFQISAKFVPSNPNIYQYTLQDCQKADMVLDAFPEDQPSNKIYGVKCFGNICDSIFDSTAGDPRDNGARSILPELHGVK